MLILPKFTGFSIHPFVYAVNVVSKVPNVLKKFRLFETNILGLFVSMQPRKIYFQNNEIVLKEVKFKIVLHIKVYKRCCIQNVKKSSFPRGTYVEAESIVGRGDIPVTFTRLLSVTNMPKGS